ncbi:MAG TPA: hypothetical protein VN946_01875 [Terriglobales bacterium]|nr:hypothetical protein [Terriglobales bacterium]
MKIMLLVILPDWNSLDSVRQAHSDLELAGLVFFALLVVAEALAHNSKQEKRKHLFDSIGIWFFAVAIVSEIAGYWYGQRNDALSEQVIVSLDAKSQEASRNASSALAKSSEAATKADTAETKSGKAITESSTAMTIASGARREADSFESKIDDARKTASEAKSQITDAFNQATAATEELNRLKIPRSLTNISPFLTAMKSFPGTEFSFSGVFGDQESRDLASAISVALQDAGWKPVLPPYAFSIGPPHFKIDNFPYEVQLGISTGIGVEIETEKTPEELNVLPMSLKPPQATAAFALKEALGKSIRPPQDGLATGPLGILADPNFRKPEFKSVLIEVGKKP